MSDFKLTKLFSALGDPTRYKIMRLIGADPSLCVSELAEECNISPAGASQHLNVLESVGLLKPRRVGKKICYRINITRTNNVLLKLIKEVA
jgi:DNA-binding transcriptional ArsR family regulator